MWKPLHGIDKGVHQKASPALKEEIWQHFHEERQRPLLETLNPLFSLIDHILRQVTSTSQRHLQAS